MVPGAPGREGPGPDAKILPVGMDFPDEDEEAEFSGHEETIPTPNR